MPRNRDEITTKLADEYYALSDIKYWPLDINKNTLKRSLKEEEARVSIKRKCIYSGLKKEMTPH